MHKAAITIKKTLSDMHQTPQDHGATGAGSRIDEWLQSVARTRLAGGSADFRQFGEVVMAKCLDIPPGEVLPWPTPHYGRVFVCRCGSAPQQSRDGARAGREPPDGCFAVIVPNHLLGSSLAGRRHVLLPKESVLVRITADFIDSLWSRGHDLDESQRSLMQWQVVELIRLCCAAPDTAADPAGGRVTLDDIHAYVSRHLSDIELTPASIAGALGISVRYLHKIMRHSGQTLCRYILDMRLDKSHRLLVNPVLTEDTVTEIALRSGFNSMTHFSRVFRQRYGVSPSQFRKALTVGA
ncbi:MAG TPA: helix-turn-helix transcriptional regulator [Spongiibacteraceae bacterium]|nr:helix-turn-helix transcriptional regulator [Spongiibacteraceae bacterium]